MKNQKKMNKIVYVLIVFLFVGCVSKKKYEALQKENKGLQYKVEALDKQVTDFSNQLTQYEKQNESLKERVEELEQQKGLDDFMIDPDPSNGEFPTVLDKQAEYVGGEKAMMEFLINNIKYPQTAKEMNLEGKVFVKFVIDESGTPSNYQIVKNVHQLLDDEALRVAKLLKKWTPAEVKGKPVKSEYVLPIIFKLK